MTSLGTISTSRWAWLRGVALAAPIVMGYVPIGFAYGVLAQQAGLATRNTVLMSLLVYAGSAQLIAVGLFATGAPALSLILTTFVVNLRHLLMSAALSPYMQHWRKGELAAFAYELTDESFAVHIARFTTNAPVSARALPKAEVFAINVTAQVSWIFGSWVGAVAGQLIADVKPLALDYALPAMFIALLVMQIKDKRHIVVAVAAGLLAVVLTLGGLGHWSVIVAALIGATLGVGLEVKGENLSAD